MIITSCTQKSIREFDETPLGKSIKRLRKLQQIQDVHIFYNNKKGMSECYNTIIEEYKGTGNTVVFVHDDVYLLDLFLEDKLDEAHKNFDVIGVAGASTFDIKRGLNGPHKKIAWHICSPPEKWSGGCYHAANDVDENMLNSYMSSFGYFNKRCIVVDGVFMSIKMKNIGGVRFPEEFTFDFYDTGFCMEAHKAGLKIGTAPITLHHCSHGNGLLSESYDKAQEVFVKKYCGGKEEKNG